PPSSDRVRLGLTVADELHLLGERLALSGSVRFEHLRNHLGSGFSRLAGEPAAPDATETLLSPQLALRARIARWLALKGSVGRFVRVPTMLEFFGDGAFVVAQPALRPE